VNESALPIRYLPVNALTRSHNSSRKFKGQAIVVAGSFLRPISGIARLAPIAIRRILILFRDKTQAPG